jgi:hypothetical protein
LCAPLGEDVHVDVCVVAQASRAQLSEKKQAA